MANAEINTPSLNLTIVELSNPNVACLAQALEGPYKPSTPCFSPIRLFGSSCRLESVSVGCTFRLFPARSARLLVTQQPVVRITVTDTRVADTFSAAAAAHTWVSASNYAWRHFVNVTIVYRNPAET